LMNGGGSSLSIGLPGALSTWGIACILNRWQRPRREKFSRQPAWGLPPAPERQKTTTWKECIRSHMEVLWATDFCTTEVWTLGGLVTYDVLCFLHVETRQVHIAGVTSQPNEQWMKQTARNITMDEWGFLTPGPSLIHEGDGTFCPAFQRIREDAGVTRVPLPPQSPKVNAIAERWVRAVNEEAWSRLMLCGPCALWYVLNAYRAHDHEERPHQGTGNVILLPAERAKKHCEGLIHCRERLGGLRKSYERDAA
jgi:putative transposase